jgi:protein-tyrosine phosphatase
MKNLADRKITSVILLALLLGAVQQSYGRNLHLVDQLPNGFRLYRSGVPSKGNLREYNELGIQEIAVLSGDAKHHELKYPDLVPGLEVVYNEKQDSGEPLTVSFLEWFDDWIQEARLEGKKIAIRCRCGCHRTGRLAAYYQMKYQDLRADDAILIMNELGKHMFLHRDLKHQVKALEDYLNGCPCSQKSKYCVIDDREEESNKIP